VARRGSVESLPSSMEVTLVAAKVGGSFLSFGSMELLLACVVVGVVGIAAVLYIKKYRKRKARL